MKKNQSNEKSGLGRFFHAFVIFLNKIIARLTPPATNMYKTISIHVLIRRLRQQRQQAHLAASRPTDRRLRRAVVRHLLANIQIVLEIH